MPTLQTVVKFNRRPILISFFCIVFYYLFAYDLIRVDYLKLVLLYSALFLGFILLMRHKALNFKFLVGVAILFRFIFLLAIPNLSQDFYRFIWDGRMLLEGLNPYLYTPESFISSLEYPIYQAQELYDGMGKLNASHFTNYPPIKQLCFSIAALISGNSILGSAIVFRLIIIAADLGTLYFGKKLLDQLKLPTKSIFWYILNPFVIIELTGNLHFEGVMVFFLIWSLYLLHTNRWQSAALLFACSISTKLIPLMFLPLFWQWFIKNGSILKQGIGKLITFYTIVGVATLLMFLPFYDSEFINNYSQTVALWFNNFEFNASIYYLARAIGYSITGYNEIAIIGKVLPVIVIFYILYLTFKKHQNSARLLPSLMLLTISVYLFFSTTVHPWYIITPLALSIFTKYKFPLVWSYVIILSYLSYIAINVMDKSENLWIIGLEYSIVFAVFIWEVVLKKSLSRQ